MSYAPIPLKDRFAKFVRKTKGCWLWTGTRTGRGYGTIKGDAAHECRTLSAHRVAYELAFGPPGDMLVCHKCDTPLCVNPKHLFLGTHADNHHDRDAKGRGPRGERSGRTHLTDEDIRVIRFLCGRSMQSQSQIARRFGIAQCSVSSIWLRQTWSHIP